MDDVRLAQLRSRLAAALGTRLELGELLGVGGFAAVFRARDPLLSRDVAIKALDPALVLDDTAADRLLDEARLVATAEHPHIVPLYEAGHRDGVVYLVMRFFPDGTLGTRLSREGPLTPAGVARLGVEVADALSAAHARGVLHLDIKPENLLLDADGHAFVADFGISRVATAADASPDGTSSGTPHYMSPEQVAGDRLDGRADVYALGVVLYEAATGKRPISGNSAVNIMANQVSKAPEPLSSVAPELPRALSDIITRALAKNPDDRWGSARDMAHALRAASASDKLLSPKLARRRTRRRWFGRTAMVVGGLALGMALIGYLALRIWIGFRTGDPPGIDASAPTIPPALVDSARALGALTAQDTALYIFAPHDHGMRDALVVTPMDLIVITDGVSRRFRHEAFTLLLARTSREGYVILKFRGGAAPDTVYRSISGLEQQILELGMRRALPH
ncbi:MAG: serine/threonine-protein kinase [Gemmatimonadales bacterium]